MANWYGIEGIEFHFMGPWADPQITYEGKRDSGCVTVEDTMWERFTEEFPDDPHGDTGFTKYMQDNADEVRYLIGAARGEWD